MRLIIWFIALSYAVNGAIMLTEPKLWYDIIPGVSMLGPYNTHFIRDVGILYMVTAGGFFLGAALGSGECLALRLHLACNACDLSFQYVVRARLSV